MVKIVRGIAKRSSIELFSTHTLRQRCPTDLARAGWDVHEIAEFAGHRCVETRLLYIHLSGRELAAKLASSMALLHTGRVAAVANAANVGSIESNEHGFHAVRRRLRPELADAPERASGP